MCRSAVDRTGDPVKYTGHMARTFAVANKSVSLERPAVTRPGVPLINTDSGVPQPGIPGLSAGRNRAVVIERAGDSPAPMANPEYGWELPDHVRLVLQMIPTPGVDDESARQLGTVLPPENKHAVERYAPLSLSPSHVN